MPEKWHCFFVKHKESNKYNMKYDFSTYILNKLNEAGEEKKANVNSNQTTVGFTSEGAESRVCDEFKKTYMRNPENVLFTPYRICPIGAHSDQPPLRPRHPAHPG